MATVLSEKMHAYEAAKAAGRVPYKVADLGLAEWGRKELRLAEARDARPDGDPQALRRQEAAGRRPHHGQPAHDDSDGRAHRDARRARRRRALGVVQHLLDAGPRRRGGRRRPSGDRRHGAGPEGHPGVRVEGRDARRVLVVHGGSAGVAGRQRPDADRRRRRRRDAVRAQGLPVREGGQGAGVQPGQGSRGVGRHPQQDQRGAEGESRAAGRRSPAPSAASARRRPPACTGCTRWRRRAS